MADIYTAFENIGNDVHYQAGKAREEYGYRYYGNAEMKLAIKMVNLVSII